MLQQKKLLSLKIPNQQVEKILVIYQSQKKNPELCWHKISTICFQPRIPFSAFKYLYEIIYHNSPEPHPVWFPDASIPTNIERALTELNFKNYAELFNWSISNREAYWDYTIKKLEVIFHKPYQDIVDLTRGIEQPSWLPGAELNIIDSCFKADPNKIAINYFDEKNKKTTISYKDLNSLVNRIANAIQKQFKSGDVLAIAMPMNITAIAIYLAIIKAGCVVAAIADSFAPNEIAIRLQISAAKAIFTQDFQTRAGKNIAIYEKVIAANAPQTIVFATNNNTHLRENDRYFADFISSNNNNFNSVPCNPNSFITVLFSSGTTGEPKAIPWTHTTAIKAAADAFFHQDITPTDVVAWPTNLGWMMGPWLVYAAFINQATMAVYGGTPTAPEFGAFIESAKVTILGLVPSIVNVWRENESMEKYDWSSIKCFSSSGECSNADDYLYLMWLANNKPIIEYCGGTEIGGGYITGTLVQPAAPALFTTPSLGLDFVLLDDDGNITSDGEVALIPPSIGLSNELLNRDHFEVYYQGMPKFNGITLRRHGDHIEKIADFCFRALGRTDDTMNLGGIKISSAEIERVLNTIPEIKETAAIAVNPNKSGPSQLVIYAVMREKAVFDLAELKNTMQQQIKSELNPLFKIHEVVIIKELPRTASNKVMRRVLRDNYVSQKN